MDDTNKQRKTKTQISFSTGAGGGGNIGGIVLWGGALAVAGLAAAFAVKRGGGRRSPSRATRKDDQAGQGLRLVLRNSSPTAHCDPCCTSNGSKTELVIRKINSCEADSTKSLILVEKTNNWMSENVISGNDDDDDDSREDEIKLCKNHTMIEEFSFPMPNHPSSQLAESRIEDDLADKFPLIEKEEEVDVLNESTHKTSSIHSASAEEPQKNDLADKFPIMEEEVEVDVLNESTEKTLSIHSASAEEPQKNDINDGAIKEIQLVERIEACKEEEPFDNGLKTSEYLTSIHSVENEGGDDDNNDVDLNIVENMEVAEQEEQLYTSKIESNKTSSEHSMEEGDKETVKESMLIENIKVLEKDAENYDLLNMSTDMTSVKHSVDDDEEEEDEEDIVEKTEENSEETESTSAGSNADEIWPEEAIEALSQELKNSLQYSLAKIAKDQTMNTEDCSGNFDNRKNSELKNCDYQTTQTPTPLKKEESEFAMANDQQKIATNWTNLNWLQHMLLLSLMVIVLFFTHRSAMYFFS